MSLPILVPLPAATIIADTVSSSTVDSATHATADAVSSATPLAAMGGHGTLKVGLTEPEKYAALYNGEVINTGEKRMVLHQMTRGQLGESVEADGVDKRAFYVPDRYSHEA